jgi:hypothetical protein
MKHKSKAKKGQFSIIAALLTVTIMIGAVIMTYATIRNLPFREPPKVLSSLEELNLSLKQLLEFAIGYYGSVMQVTGNVSYAKDLTLNYLQSGLVYIAHSHPEWNPSFEINSLDFSTRWYEITSYSIGNLSITYSMPSLGMSKITYNTSALLNVGILDTVNGKSKVLVTREGNKPDLALGKGNFFFYKYSDSTWNLINPSTEPIVFSNGTYMLQIPSGVEQSSYLIKVSDSKGIMAMAFFSTSRQPRYTYTLTWNSTLYSSLTTDTIVVEALQNGTLRWLGQNLQFSTSAKPIIPIPIRTLRVNQTINGISREVPFQVEDWGSNYRVPLGLTSNASLFGDRQMIVFLVNHNVQKVTLWWDGRDTAEQTSYAWKNRYFTGDNPASRRLTNGILTLTISPIPDFEITSSVTGGSITGTASFMRINTRDPVYWSDPAYVIHHGIVRDIVQEEAEWSGGITNPNCPNVYSQIYLTLPANATYYTYALRLIFVNSSRSRTITDLSAIQLSSGWIPGTLTENGTNSGSPIIGKQFAGQNRLFYNFSSPSTGWAHHWSEYIRGNTGAGIMFTNSSNLNLYTFDKLAPASQKGALSVTSTDQRTVWTTPTAVYSKCNETSPNVASRAIDENEDGSYWQHSNTDNHWIIFDMGQTMNISRIRIHQSGTPSYRWGQSAGVDVYVSDNPSSWGSAVWSGNLSGSDWQPSRTFSAQGRYVKLYSRSNSPSQRLYEVDVETREEKVTIEFKPVGQGQAGPPFTNPLDVTWYGAVVTFNNEPIYPTSGNKGLWIIAEYPPKVAID